jgi:hypothetical protein
MMLSAAQGRRQRKQLDRQRELAIRAAAKRKVRELRAAVREARAGYVGKVREARALCARNKKHVRARARERRKRLLEQLRMLERGERESAKNRCQAGKAGARQTARSALERSRLLLAEERRYQEDLRRIELANKAQRRAHFGRVSAAERRQESDGEVLANIDPALVPLWNRIGRKIRGSSRQSRTEAFLHYAHEHPREVIEAQEGNADEMIRELERQAEAAHRHSRKRRYTAAELADVPF